MISSSKNPTTKSEEIRQKYHKKGVISTTTDEHLINSSMMDQRRKTCVFDCFSTRPFQIIIGLLFLIPTFLIFLSTLLSSIDKAANTICGAKCGFILDNPLLFNPLNSLLILAARVFPLDYILLSVVIFYLFAATIRGILRVGIRLLWIKLYDINPHSTMPQALLLCAVTLMLSLLTANINLFTLMPQYSIFGSQHYVPSILISV